MDTVHVKVTRDGQSPRHISGANFKGYLIGIKKKGVGRIIRTEIWSNGFDDADEENIYEKYEELYMPYFDNAQIAKHFKDVDGFKKKYGGDTDIRQIIGTEAEKCLLRWGQGDGILVEDADEAKKRELEEKMQRQKAEILEQTGFIFDLEKKTWFEDEDGKSPCFSYKITHVESGRVFTFTDRNIFDFGRVVNPTHVDGGILIDVEEFIRNNPVTFSGRNADEYRAEHPSETGCGWERNFVADNSEDKRTWVPVDKIELQAFTLVKKYGQAYTGIRL